jgi:rhodanese-related sulfurtransferase
VLGVLPGIVGTIQATEAIKLTLGIGEPLIGRLLLIDALTLTFRKVTLRRDPNCPVCGTREITTLVDYEEFCGLRRAAAEERAAAPIAELTPASLASKLGRRDDFDLIDVREPHEYQIARIDGARLIPLAQLPDAIGTLSLEREIIVHCKTGRRSAQAVRTLQEAGFRHVWNLAGGIARWSADVDPSVPTY